MREMKYFIYILFALALFSCDKEDDLGPSRIKKENIEKSGLDKKIYDRLTVPYNIEVKYKWDGNEVDFNKFLTPVLPECADFFLEAIEESWIKPYEKCGGADFIKTYCFGQ